VTISRIAGVLAASRRRTAAGTPTVLGYSTKGTVSAAFSGAGGMWVVKNTLASPGTLIELHGWFGGAAGNAVRIVVYDDDATGALPGTRLAYSSSLALPSSGDVDLFESGLSVPLAAGDYWVGYICQATAGSFYRDATGTAVSHQQILSGAAYTPPPSPFGTPAASGTRRISCWGVVLT
jgi:hypothetical protein